MARREAGAEPSSFAIWPPPRSRFDDYFSLPPGGIENLAYFFEYEYGDGRRPHEYLDGTLKKLEIWKSEHGGDLFKEYGAEPELTIVDTRPGRPERRHPLSGLQREIYEYCGEIRTYPAIAASSSNASKLIPNSKAPCTNFSTS